VILILRTYVIWDRNVIVLIYLSAMQAISIAVIIFQLDQSLKSLIFIPSPSPAVVPCVPMLGINRMFSVYLVVMGVDLNLLCMTFYRGLSQWQRDSVPLIHTLYRDGIYYFVALFALSLANAIVIFKLFDSPYYYIMSEEQRVLHAILAARLIINLRKEVDVTEVETTPLKSFRDVFTGSIQFASGLFSGGRSTEEA